MPNNPAVVVDRRRHIRISMSVDTALSDLIHEKGPRNRELLDERARLQEQIDAWHRDHRPSFDRAEYREFLEEIGYLVPEGDPFQIDTTAVDAEIAAMSGPQLVVPVSNARYALKRRQRSLGVAV